MRRLALIILAVLATCAPSLSAPSSQRANPQQVRRELRQILAAREYNRSTRQSAVEKFFIRTGKAIMRGVKTLVAWVADHLKISVRSKAGPAAVIGAWAVVIGFLVLLVFIIRKLVGGRIGGKSHSQSPAAAGYQIPTAKAMTVQAAKLAEAGDYRGAFKAAYLASIAYLDEIRALRFERSRTNWEYLRELKTGGHERPHSELYPLTQDFDRKIYGRESCSKEDYLKALSVHDRLSDGEAK